MAEASAFNVMGSSYVVEMSAASVCGATSPPQSVGSHFKFSTAVAYRLGPIQLDLNPSDVLVPIQFPCPSPCALGPIIFCASLPGPFPTKRDLLAQDALVPIQFRELSTLDPIQFPDCPSPRALAPIQPNFTYASGTYLHLVRWLQSYFAQFLSWYQSSSLVLFCVQ